ncbi:hypothetical protein SALBM311S_06727 [Streptomyces alboniger]
MMTGSPSGPLLQHRFAFGRAGVAGPAGGDVHQRVLQVCLLAGRVRRRAPDRIALQQPPPVFRSDILRDGDVGRYRFLLRSASNSRGERASDRLQSTDSVNTDAAFRRVSSAENRT